MLNRDSIFKMIEREATRGLYELKNKQNNVSVIIERQHDLTAKTTTTGIKKSNTVKSNKPFIESQDSYPQ